MNIATDTPDPFSGGKTIYPKGKMKQLVVAFDVDGTLITKESAASKQVVANEDWRTILINLARSARNVRIVVWSGSGEYWARYVVINLGLDNYVDEIMAKNTDLKPDIAFDDIPACILGDKNIIVTSK